LAVYHSFAVGLTKWENHAYHSTHAKYLTLKVFTLAAIVSYLGLALSAFVYVPYGEVVMDVVQKWLFSETPVICKDIAKEGLNATMVATCAKRNLTGLWEMDVSNARLKLNPSRLQNEMFTYTVTNQIVGTFTEVGLPYILRAFNAFRNGKSPGLPIGKKRAVIETEQREGERREEGDFLEIVKNEVALPDYEIYEDYREMVTQFGYVALWSTIWPLAPGKSAVHDSIFY
jgi:anoctamin-10